MDKLRLAYKSVWFWVIVVILVIFFLFVPFRCVQVQCITTPCPPICETLFEIVFGRGL